jgi:hypothetical protein
MKSSWTRRALMIGALAFGHVVVAACGATQPDTMGDGTLANASSGTCNTDGTTRVCHYTVPQPGMLVCGTGSQTCEHGSWTPCAPGLEGNTLTLHPEYTYDPSAPPGSRLASSGLLGTMSLVSVAPGACVNNPCDPNCLQVPLPLGQICGQLSEKPNETYKDLTNAGFTNNPNPCTVGANDNCGYDSDCAADGHCHFNKDTTRTCAGVDFTAGNACAPDTGTNVQIPVCNRGQTDATSGILKIAVKAATAPSLTACNRLATATVCSIDLSATPIKAGQCVDFDQSTCPVLANNTQYEFEVNDDGAGGARLPECNSCNNWGAFDTKMNNNRGCSLACNTKDLNGNDVNYNGLPGGFQGNPTTCNVEDPTTTDVAGTPAGTDPTTAPPADDCNYDFACVGGTCQSFNRGDANHCVGVDLTAGVGCVAHEGHMRFPICNRGSVRMNSTAITVGLASGTSSALVCTAGLAASGAIDKGTCTVTMDLDPGECQNLDTEHCGAGFQDNGNRLVFVDTTNAVAECDECNNWSAYAQNDKCGHGSLSTALDFQVGSACPPGYLARWGKLFYAVSTPGSSKVVFKAQTGATASGPWAPASAVTIADTSAGDGDICAIACAGPGQCNGPYAAPYTSLWPPNKTSAVCPKDMTVPLGVNAKGAFLSLSMQFTSGRYDHQDQTPSNLAPPVVMFDCIPNE